MSTTMRIEFENEAEIKALIRTLPTAYQPKVQKMMIGNATKLLIQSTRSMIPKSRGTHKARGHTIASGTLGRSIGLINIAKAKTVTMVIGPRVKGAFGGYKGGWYGHWVEFGHKIRRGKSGRFENTRRGKITTGFIQGRPYMARSWQAGSGAVRQRFNDESVAIFNKFVAKYKAKGKL